MSYKHIVPLLVIALVLAACGGAAAPTAAPAAAPAATKAPAAAGQTIVGLITKTETNPFFVKMKEGAQAKANELGVKLM
jgi:ABC-type sugar transport system substrate-binding protein